MEADDLGTYVVKFTGAGQGRKALIAEIIGTTLARALGLSVADLVTVDVDPILAANEPDEEVQDLLRASPGLNLGIDFLPGALDLDVGAFAIDSALAGRVLWFDAFIGNVDRTWRNPNMLYWHGSPYLIDHGAALTFHHNWATPLRPYDPGEHALLGSSPDLDAAEAALAPLVTADMLSSAVAQVPAEWLTEFDTVERERHAYVEALLARLAARESWLPSLRAAVSNGRPTRAVAKRNRPGWLDR